MLLAFCEYLSEHILPTSQADKDNLFLISYQAFQTGLDHKELGYVLLDFKSCDHIQGAQISPRSFGMKSPIRLELHFCSLDHLIETEQKIAVNFLLDSKLKPEKEVVFFMGFYFLNTKFYNDLKIYKRSQIYESVIENKARYLELRKQGFQ